MHLFYFYFDVPVLLLFTSSLTCEIVNLSNHLTLNTGLNVMLTFTEAKQRVRVNGFELRYLASFQEYQVYKSSWTKEESINLSYFTTCLEDAVITSGTMQRRYEKEMFKALCELQARVY
jgi:hypothetical protein